MESTLQIAGTRNRMNTQVFGKPSSSYANVVVNRVKKIQHVWYHHAHRQTLLAQDI